MKSLTIRRSVAGRLFFWLLPLLAAAIVLPLLLLRWLDDVKLVALVSALVIVPLAVAVIRRALAPLNSLFRALAGSVNTYRDGEYNSGIHWQGSDDLGDLVRSHAELGEVLRDQRQGLVQRELLLDTMVQNTPVAMLLVAENGPIVTSSPSSSTLRSTGTPLTVIPFLLSRSTISGVGGSTPAQ
jgi:hypothetical protein